MSLEHKVRQIIKRTSVSGDGNSALAFTWAARPLAGIAAGLAGRVTDVGLSPGAPVVWDGAKWVLSSPIELLAASSGDGASSTAEQILRQITVPAGLLRACRSLTVQAMLGKTGTTGTLTPRVRIGAAGTLADATNPVATSVAATNLTASFQFGYFVENATTLRRMGSYGGSAFLWGNPSSSAYPEELIVADVDTNALIFSASMQAASAADIVRVNRFSVTLLP